MNVVLLTNELLFLVQSFLYNLCNSPAVKHGCRYIGLVDIAAAADAAVVVFDCVFAIPVSSVSSSAVVELAVVDVVLVAELFVVSTPAADDDEDATVDLAAGAIPSFLDGI